MILPPNKRMIKILQALAAGKRSLTGNNLARIIAQPRSGYKIVVERDDQYAKLNCAYSLEVSSEYRGIHVIPSDAHDRMNFIIARILLNLLHGKIVNQEELADDFSLDYQR